MVDVISEDEVLTSVFTFLIFKKQFLFCVLFKNSFLFPFHGCSVLSSLGKVVSDSFWEFSPCVAAIPSQSPR